jgi:hypothetical protein
MSIEINELVVNATIDEGQTANYGQSRDDLYLGLEELKAQIISDCKDLFYELLDKQRDR